MRVILTKPVKDLGKAGDLVEVSEGYARNFLVPRCLAMEATPAALKHHRERLRQEQLKQDRIREEARQFAHRLEAAKVTLTAKAGEGGRLYGAVTNKEIGQAIKTQAGLEVDKRKIELDEPIRSLGAFTFTVKLHPDVSARMKVTVITE